MPGLFIAIILALFAVLAWRDLKFALTVLLVFLPAYLLRFELVIPWTVLEGMILIAIAVWLAKGRVADPSVRNMLDGYAWPMGLMFVAATLAIVWAPDTLAALGVWKAYLIEPAMVFVMLRSTFTERNDWDRALVGLGITVIALSIFAIFQKLTGQGLPIPWDIERRATSLFEYPNALGLFVAPIIAAMIARFPSLTCPWTRLAFAGTIPFGVLAIVLAETEAAFVAIPVALVVTLALSAPLTPPIHGGKFRLAILAGLVVIATVAASALPAVREKLLLQDYSGQVRISQWKETIVMLKDRPLQGAGLSGYPTVFAPYHDPTLYEVFQYPHNIFLNFWVELGFLGVIALLWMMITVFKITLVRRNDAIVLAAFAALLTMTIHGLVDVPFFKNDLAVLTAFFLAMTLTKPLTVDG